MTCSTSYCLYDTSPWNVCMLECTYVHSYVCAYIYIYIHTHIRTYSAVTDVEYKVSDNIQYFGSKLFFIRILLAQTLCWKASKY